MPNTEHRDSTDNLGTESRRLTANEIFDAAVRNAREELRRSTQKLTFSGIAGGVTMGLTGIGVASMGALIGTGGWRDLVSYLIYPIGFIAVIIGRAQLFTENTLYPVILVFDERRHILRTLRLWGVVFTANVAGAFLFASCKDIRASRTREAWPGRSMQHPLLRLTGSKSAANEDAHSVTV